MNQIQFPTQKKNPIYDKPSKQSNTQLNKVGTTI